MLKGMPSGFWPPLEGMSYPHCLAVFAVPGVPVFDKFVQFNLPKWVKNSRLLNYAKKNYPFIKSLTNLKKCFVLSQVKNTSWIIYLERYYTNNCFEILWILQQTSLASSRAGHNLCQEPKSYKSLLSTMYPVVCTSNLEL